MDYNLPGSSVHRNFQEKILEWVAISYSRPSTRFCIKCIVSFNLYNKKLNKKDAILCTIARTWKQPRSPSTDEWIKKLWYIYTMEYYLAIKRNECESTVVRWMNWELVTDWSKSEREKQILYTNAYIWSLKKNSWWTYSQRRNGDTDIENGLVDTAGEGEVRTNWESSTDIHTSSCVKHITSGKSLYGTGRPAWPSVTSGGVGRRRPETEGIYIQLWLIVTDVQQRPPQHCKAIILQLKRERKKDPMMTVVPLYRWEK